jgi:hypothetical protein
MSGSSANLASAHFSPRRGPLSGATSLRFTLLAAIGSSRADQVVAEDERTKEKGEDDVPPPPTAFRASVNQ